jgi:hypothetical protein
VSGLRIVHLTNTECLKSSGVGPQEWGGKHKLSTSEFISGDSPCQREVQLFPHFPGKKIIEKGEIVLRSHSDKKKADKCWAEG